MMPKLTEKRKRKTEEPEEIQKKPRIETPVSMIKTLRPGIIFLGDCERFGLFFWPESPL